MDLSGLKAIWDSMTPQEREQKIKALNEIQTVRSLCEAKGWVETMPSLSGIKVIKNRPEVKRLKKLLELAGVQGVKWVEKKPLRPKKSPPLSKRASV